MSKDIFRKIFSAFVQPECVNCKSIGAIICKQCRDKIEWTRKPICKLCGRKRNNLRFDTCWSCRNVKEQALFVRSATFFKEPMPAAVYSLKYRGLFAVAEPVAEFMKINWDKIWAHPVDLVIPIPLHAERRYERGYNQAEELARYFAPSIKSTMATDLLFRQRNTKPQVQVQDAESRRKNLEGAFKADMRVQGKRVLLIDDVCTTGSTLRAAADALYIAGAKRVSAYTAARAVSLKDHNFRNVENSADDKPKR